MKLKLDLHKVFNHIAGWLVDDTISSIRLGAWNQKSFPANEPSTIKAKGHRKPLMGKNRDGAWLNKSKYVIQKASSGKQESSVTIPESDIASYNQAPTGAGTIKKAREFWGISKRLERKADTAINYELNKQFDYNAISNGWKKV